MENGHYSPVTISIMVKHCTIHNIFILTYYLCNFQFWPLTSFDTVSASPLVAIIWTNEKCCNTITHLSLVREAHCANAIKLAFHGGHLDITQSITVQKNWERVCFSKPGMCPRRIPNLDFTWCRTLCEIYICICKEFWWKTLVTY